MRVLVTSPAGLGHIHPMVPLARALGRRGHDVLWAVPADGVERVDRAGIPAVSVGDTGMLSPMQSLQQFPELRDLPPAEIPEYLFAKLFGAIAAPSVLRDLEPLGRQWKPDLVVCDQGELAGHIVAAELGIPSVTKGFGPLLPARRIELASYEVAPLWKERGLEPPSFAGCYETLYLDIYPPELVLEPADHVPKRQLLSPLGDEGTDEPSAPPPLPDGSAGSPLVYVTMGTVFNNPGLLEDVVAAVAGLARVMVTVGPTGDPAAFGSLPDHVRVERYVPQHALLPHCDVVVSHAGSGTTLAALSHGVPQLSLPQGADQFLNARAVTNAGAGLWLSPQDTTRDAVREAVTRLLAEPPFREAAVSVGQSIAAMPSPEEVVEVLESLV